MNIAFGLLHSREGGHSKMHQTAKRLAFVSDILLLSDKTILKKNGELLIRLLLTTLFEIIIYAIDILETIRDPEFFGTRVGCHVSAVEWV